MRNFVCLVRLKFGSKMRGDEPLTGEVSSAKLSLSFEFLPVESPKSFDGVSKRG